ncbi:hypothetical protein PHMEG_00040513 [Phytophthora megakarya]|uniref:Uncharacterized protein n=1 Tax=Phytophthora megakarya TaxID=4795 RepID=A0A225UD83_9STRA|nr:hypothetical protein PHMEG_00040513 [Phytophthora megakarya]
MSLPLQDEVQVRLTVKIGPPFTNSRMTYGQPLIFPFMPRVGHDELRANINSELTSFIEIVWEDAALILVRPCANASQANFVAFSASQPKFISRIDKLWKQASRRKNGYSLMIALMQY